jgi:hypothetical protein
LDASPAGGAEQNNAAAKKRGELPMPVVQVREDESFENATAAGMKVQQKKR